MTHIPNSVGLSEQASAVVASYFGTLGQAFAATEAPGCKTETRFTLVSYSSSEGAGRNSLTMSGQVREVAVLAAGTAAHSTRSLAGC